MKTSVKVGSLGVVLERVAQWRQAGEEVVFTNGCFDLLHLGHVTLLETARSYGDRLIVGLNSDASVRRLKGSDRPLNSFEDRAYLLAALQVVDAVVGFEEDTPEALISELRPQILVKGGDYAIEAIVGSEIVQKIGGKVHIVPFVSGYSSTQIIEKVQKKCRD